MKIGGLQKTTLLDYPGHIACTVFLIGCNLRCPFCHNASLVIPESDTANTPAVHSSTPNYLSEAFLLSFLKTRIGKLDGVCITGGEPTLYQTGLPELLRQIKAMGFQIKLDTNGTNPDFLKYLITEQLIDYIAMDIKNAPGAYSETCGGPDVIDRVRKSVSLLMQDTIDYEFRTTVVKPFHTPERIREIGEWICGAKRYYLQQFVDSGDLLINAGSNAHRPGRVLPPDVPSSPSADTPTLRSLTLSAFSAEEMQHLRETVLTYVPNAAIRGIT